jgi:hypothetical protein
MSRSPWAWGDACVRECSGELRYPEGRPVAARVRARVREEVPYWAVDALQEFGAHVHLA